MCFYLVGEKIDDARVLHIDPLSDRRRDATANWHYERPMSPPATRQDVRDLTRALTISFAIMLATAVLVFAGLIVALRH